MYPFSFDLEFLRMFKRRYFLTSTSRFLTPHFEFSFILSRIFLFFLSVLKMIRSWDSFSLTIYKQFEDVKTALCRSHVSTLAVRHVCWNIPVHNTASECWKIHAAFSSIHPRSVGASSSVCILAGVKRWTVSCGTNTILNFFLLLLLCVWFISVILLLCNWKLFICNRFLTYGFLLGVVKV